MPAIYVFQKRTLLGGDDLQVPALVTVLARVVQGGLLVLPQAYYLIQEADAAASDGRQTGNDNDNGNGNGDSSSPLHYLLEFLWVDPQDDGAGDNVCRHSHLYPLLTSMYLLATLLLGVAYSISIEYRLWWWSGQGTPTLYRQPRTSQVERLLECKLLVFTVLLAFIFLIWASSLLFCAQFLQCRAKLEEQQQQQQQQGNTGSTPAHWMGSNSWWIANVLLAFSQISEVLLAVAFWARLVQVDRMHARMVLGAEHQPPPQDPHEFTEELWAQRCRWMCQCLSMSTCFVLGGRDFLHSNDTTSPTGAGVPYYKQLSQAMADYMETRGTLDVVPTDLLTGLLVLQRLQRQRILQARLQVVRSSILTEPHHPSMVPPSYKAGIMDRPLTRSVSDIPTHHPNTNGKSPLKLRRPHGGSSNDLFRSGTGVGNAASPAPTSASTLTSASAALSLSASHSPSVDLPETTRLVVPKTNHNFQTRQSYPGATPSTQPIFRRLDSQQDDDDDDQENENKAPPSVPSPPRRRRPNTNGPGSALYYETQTRTVLNPHNPIDLARLRDGARMAKFALSIYTWMLYLFVNPVTGLPRLLCRSCHLCRSCSKKMQQSGFQTPGSTTETSGPGGVASRSSLLHHATSRGNTPTAPTIIGDNLCGWHKQSLLLVADLPDTDLVYAQLANRFSMVPYCILVDHETQSVVVSVRGSLSLDDLITDVNMDPENVYELGQEFGFDANREDYCHAGIVASARNVYADLEGHGLLEELLCHEYPEYQLRLVGHSLGASVATLLGFMLRSRFPSLQVFNFSPPGGSMTWGLATQCESWAASYILDSDIVPRLTVLALERLRNEVLELVGRLKVPKYQVVESFWTGQSRRACCWGATSENATQDLEDLTELIDEWLFDEEPFHAAAAGLHGSPAAMAPPSAGHHPNLSPYQTTTYYQHLQEFWRIQAERKQRRGSLRSVRLYPPGRMIHLLKTGQEGGCGHLAKKVATCCTTNSGFQYTPVYIANDDLDEIVVSPTMATDHFIDRMVDELDSLAQTYAITSMTADHGGGDAFVSRDNVV